MNIRKNTVYLYGEPWIQFLASAKFLKAFYFGCFVQENMHLHAYSGTRIKNVEWRNIIYALSHHISIRLLFQQII